MQNLTQRDKLMNNENFGMDCRDNTNNSTFELIIDEINEISYLKRYYSLFDNKISGFINSEILEKKLNKNLARAFQM